MTKLIKIVKNISATQRHYLRLLTAHSRLNIYRSPANSGRANRSNPQWTHEGLVDVLFASPDYAVGGNIKTSLPGPETSPMKWEIPNQFGFALLNRQFVLKSIPTMQIIQRPATFFAFSRFSALKFYANLWRTKWRINEISNSIFWNVLKHKRLYRVSRFPWSVIFDFIEKRLAVSWRGFL